MSATAIVTEIERFALYDGPGIRTTVFVKGCPLHCVWCHNPECISHPVQLSYQQSKCTLCGRCVQVCPNSVHLIDQGAHTVAFDRCICCGACTQACLNGAVKVIGRQLTAEEVMHSVVRDMRYYQKSGGGLTISGGEPLASPGFTLELLQLARKQDIHTAVETSGFAPAGVVEKLLPWVDLFLFDYKETDPSLHQAYTGVDNTLILNNLELLATHGAHIILRCPIIRGYNDRMEHYQGIATLLRRYPAIRHCECMAYHTLGISKYQHIGKEYRVSSTTFSSEEKEKIMSCINSLTPIPVTWG